MATAYTYLQKAQYVSPVNNNIVFILSSSSVSYSGFNYVVDVFSSGTQNRVSRLIIPATDNGIGKAYINPDLNPEISYNWNPGLTGSSNPANQTRSYFKYDLYAGHQFQYYWPFNDNFFASGGYVGFSGNTAHTYAVGDRVFIDQAPGYTYSAYNGVHTIIGLSGNNCITINQTFLGSTSAQSGQTIYSDFRVTTFSGIDTSVSAYTAHNAVINTDDFITYNYTDYNLKTGATAADTGKFYTSASSGLEVKRTNPVIFNVISTGGSGNYKFLFITTENTTGGTEQFQINCSTANSTFAQIGVGPQNLSASTYQIINGTAGIIKSNVTKYTAYTQNNLSARTSQDFVFNINTYCARFENIEILFLDSKGSWIPMNFELLSTQSIKNDRSAQYTKKLGTWNGTSFGYNSYDRGTTIINNIRNYRYKAKSNWLTFDQQILVDELMNSIEVYWRYNDRWLAINITTDNWDRSLTDIDAEPKNFEFEFELANNYGGQIGG